MISESVFEEHSALYNVNDTVNNRTEQVSVGQSMCITVYRQSLRPKLAALTHKGLRWRPACWHALGPQANLRIMIARSRRFTGVVHSNLIGAFRRYPEW